MGLIESATRNLVFCWVMVFFIFLLLKNDTWGRATFVSQIIRAAASCIMLFMAGRSFWQAVQMLQRGESVL